MEKISFTKMSGAGNDFIILRDFPSDTLDPILIKNLCSRRNGIGADGVITIKSGDGIDFRMQYYNSDGSTGSLCGNGARCAIKFAYDSGLTKGPGVKFISGTKKYSGQVLENDRIQFNLLSPEAIRRNFEISLIQRSIKVSFADTGSPHVLIFIDEVSSYYGTKYSLDEIPVDGLGREIRNHSEFSPGGTNVNFIQIDKDRIRIRTYERGVEEETYACGTGSVAAAVISFLEGKVKPPVKILTRSREELEVSFGFDQNKFSDVSLTGPAKTIFIGEYRI